MLRKLLVVWRGLWASLGHPQSHLKMPLKRVIVVLVMVLKMPLKPSPTAEHARGLLVERGLAAPMVRRVARGGGIPPPPRIPWRA